MLKRILHGAAKQPYLRGCCLPVRITSLRTGHWKYHKKNPRCRRPFIYQRNHYKMSQTRALKQDLVIVKEHFYEGNQRVRGIYRPFKPQWLYFDRHLNEMIHQMPRLFPDTQAENSVLVTSGLGGRSAFSCLMSDLISSLLTADIYGSQCFPRFIYNNPKPTSDKSNDLFTIEAPQT